MFYSTPVAQINGLKQNNATLSDPLVRIALTGLAAPVTNIRHDDLHHVRHCRISSVGYKRYSRGRLSVLRQMDLRLRRAVDERKCSTARDHAFHDVDHLV